jgi:catechol 2,3-dioxygenase-like lactoylglutathione lyase family enzyme
MIHELNHIGIVVTDLDKSVDFYTRLLGAKKVWGTIVEAAGMDIVYLQLAQGLVELLSFTDNALPIGTNHLGFYSDNLDEDFARIVAQGAEPVVEPRVAASGAGRQAIVRDPNGSSIELLQRDLPLRHGTVPHPHIQAIDHFALQTNDHDRTFEFYTRELGMAVAKQIPIPALKTTLTYLHHGQDVLEILPNIHGGARLHHIALAVDNVEATLAHLASIGGTPDGPARPAAGGVGSIGSVTDPDGTVIEFLDRPRTLEGLDEGS